MNILTVIVSVTYYLDLHNAIYIFFIMDIIFHQVELLVFYSAQTTN